MSALSWVVELSLVCVGQVNSGQILGTKVVTDFNPVNLYQGGVQILHTYFALEKCENQTCIMVIQRILFRYTASIND